MTLKEIWNNGWKCLMPKSSDGFSLKNIMASATHISLLFLTFKHTDMSNLIVVIGLWQGYILILMGLRTYEKKSDILTDKSDPKVSDAN